MKQGIIYRKTDGPFRYQAWPSVCCDENGVLYAVCSGHRVAHVCPFGKNLMFTSHDGGETWSPPIIVNDTRLDDRDAGITYLGNGKMIDASSGAGQVRITKSVLSGSYWKQHFLMAYRIWN